MMFLIILVGVMIYLFLIQRRMQQVQLLMRKPATSRLRRPRHHWALYTLLALFPIVLRDHEFLQGQARDLQHAAAAAARRRTSIPIGYAKVFGDSSVSASTT